MHPRLASVEMKAKGSTSGAPAGRGKRIPLLVIVEPGVDGAGFWRREFLGLRNFLRDFSVTVRGQEFRLISFEAYQRKSDGRWIKIAVRSSHCVQCREPFSDLTVYTLPESSDPGHLRLSYRP
jgi:hypothetical protein